jgi:hypothetical protein
MARSGTGAMRVTRVVLVTLALAISAAEASWARSPATSTIPITWSFISEILHLERMATAKPAEE